MEPTSVFTRSLLVALLWCVALGRAIADPVLVLYPEAPDPYRQAFDQIMTGLARTAGGPLDRRMVTATTERGQIQSWLDEASPDAAVVLLGRPTVALSEIGRDRLGGDHRVFVGGINALPGQTPWPGLSLIAEPALYLQTLHELLPNVRRVIAFYHAQDREWATRATRAAADLGLRIEPVAVDDAPSAVRRIAEALKTLDPNTTALWFAANTLDLDRELIFPWVLEQTWDRRIAAFSDTAAHAKRGFLFALYPDYVEVGAELGRRIRQGAAGRDGGFALTRAVRFALNGRTARHLGIALGDDLVRRAQPLYPQP
ncbi:MAG: ABC transporter substrate binding protein [Candidatus Competibacter sp.]